MKTAKIYLALAAQVTYNPETGIITWNFREELTGHDKMFNSRFAGHECGSIDSHGYRVISFKHEGKSHNIKAHRLAWLITYGYMAESHIDHVNRNRKDNRIDNLRDVHPSTNQRNMSMMRTNKSGITGVYWDKQSKKWRAQASLNGKTRYIGIFSCINEAAAAAKSFRVKYGFTDSHGCACYAD